MAESSDLSHDNLRAAQMIQSGQGQAAANDRGAGIWESRGIGNSYLITTADGNVIVNAGTLADARRGKMLFDAVSDAPVRAIILTQSHANQYGGLEVFKTSANEVIAHRLYPMERASADALFPHYRRGSARIFGGITGKTEELLPTIDIPVDRLVGDEGYAFDLGGRRFEILWTPGGETRSAVIIWLPQDKTAIVGNLFGPLFGNHPNLNTMRGDRPRSAKEFISSVQTLRALHPEKILTGHEEIVGEAHIQAETTRIIDAVQWVHDCTAEGMNAGIDLQTLMRTVTTPPHLTLTEEYGKIAWNVRAIWHEYTGWFDPACGTTELYGVPVSSIGPALAKLSGGAEAMAMRARDFVATGQPLEALHLLDLALAADAGCDVAKRFKRDALLALDIMTGGQNLWERRWIASEIAALNLANE